MLDQAGALESPGTDSTSSISPDLGGTRRSRRRHKKRSKQAAQLLAESLDSAAEPRNSPEDYAGSQAGFQSVHSILHPDSPGESASQGFSNLAQHPGLHGEAGDSRTAQGGAGLEGFLHAAHSGQGGLFQAEAMRRVSQDSSGVSPVHLLVTCISQQVITSWCVLSVCCRHALENPFRTSQHIVDIQHLLVHTFLSRSSHHGVSLV